ncbi:YncE family protein [Microbacteriaceae bacterium 4G12]
MKQLFVFLLLIIVCTGCDTKTYAPIRSQEPLIITTNIKDGSVSFIGENKNKLLATWHLNKAIMGSVLLPDGDTLAVYGKQLNAMYVYSLRTGKQIGEWDVGKGISNAVIAANKKEVLLANQEKNTVQIYTLQGKEKKSIPVGKAPLTIVQDDNHAYVLNFNDTKLSIIDMHEQKVVGQWDIPLSSTGAILRSKEKELWIGGHGSGEQVNTKVSIYGLDTGTVLKTIEAPEMPVSFTADDQYMYVLSHGSSTLRKIDGHTYEEVATVEIGANPFAVWQSDEQLYVASYDSDEVYVINPKNMKIKKIISVGKGPFHFVERGGEK